MASTPTLSSQFYLHRAPETALRLANKAGSSLARALRYDRTGQPPALAAHVAAAAMATVLIVQASLVAGGLMTLDHNRSWTGTPVLIAVQLIATRFYSAYYLPALSCLVLFIGSFGSDQTLADTRYLVLLPGALAGSAYIAASIWWRTRLRALPQRAQVLDRVAGAGDGLFEIGKRYLAAWLLVFAIDEVAPLLDGQFSATEHTVAEAGGVIVLIDLIALLGGRIRACQESLTWAARTRPRPRPHWQVACASYDADDVRGRVHSVRTARCRPRPERAPTVRQPRSVDRSQPDPRRSAC